MISVETRTRPLTVRITSPGGSVDSGIEIYEMLRNHGKVATHGIGTVASIATIIFAGADRRVSFPSARYMLHGCHTGCYGDAAEMRRAAHILEVHTATIGNIYSERMNVQRPQLDEWLSSEKWFTATEALGAGLVTEIGRSVSQPFRRKSAASLHRPSSKYKWTDIPNMEPGERKLAIAALKQDKRIRLFKGGLRAGLTPKQAERRAEYLQAIRRR